MARSKVEGDGVGGGADRGSYFFKTNIPIYEKGGESFGSFVFVVSCFLFSFVCFCLFGSGGLMRS